MDVVCDGPTNRHVFRAGARRQEPPSGDDQCQDLAEGDARLAAQEARLLVEGDEVIQAAGIEQDAAVVEAAVPIASPEAAGEYRAIGPAQSLSYIATGEMNNLLPLRFRVAAKRFTVFAGQIRGKAGGVG